MAKKPQVIEKNAGAKIPWRVSGTKLFFGDDDIMVNLANRQREYPVHEDVCADRNGNLVLGTGAGQSYVAQIDIPPYAYPDAGPDAAPDGGAPAEPLPLDVEQVTLTMWSIDGIHIS